MALKLAETQWSQSKFFKSWIVFYGPVALVCTTGCLCWKQLIIPLRQRSDATGFEPVQKLGQYQPAVPYFESRVMDDLKFDIYAMVDPKTDGDIIALLQEACRELDNLNKYLEELYEIMEKSKK